MSDGPTGIDAMKQGKFTVQHWRRGEIDPDDCFGLVPPRDPAAVAAIRAYAAATPNAGLAAILIRWADRLEGTESADPSLDLQHRVAMWTGILAEEVKAGRMAIETALQRIAGHAASLP